MNIIVDGQALTTAATEIDVAIRQLALIGQRIAPTLSQLGGSDGLSSNNIDQKYYCGLIEYVAPIMRDLEALQHNACSMTSEYIANIDDIDQFMY